MQFPGPVGPAWNLRLFRHVSLIFFLTPCALVFIGLGLRLLPEAAVFATSATIFGCTWRWAGRLHPWLERWGRRPGYGQGVLVQREMEKPGLGEKLD